MIEGVDNVLRNIANSTKGIQDALEKGMDYALRDTVNHIKQEFVWSKNRKGFNDRTGLLRKSISHQTENVDQSVIGWIYSNVEYAPHVELKWGGRHAYMWPGINEKRQDIYNTLGKFIRNFIT